jgi:hypothetical protein
LFVNAQLIESTDEHHWVLLDHKVTQVVVDLRSFRLQSWSLDGSTDIRCAAPSRLRLASGLERPLDPNVPEGLTPLLGLVGRALRSLTVTRAGILVVTFSDGSTLETDPHPRANAWEVQGGGVLEGMSYVCAPGGGSPWA